MSEQHIAAVWIEHRERIPQLGRLPRQLLGPAPVPALATAVSLRPDAWLPKTTLFTSISRQDSGV
jgi:hypothetical protein